MSDIMEETIMGEKRKPATICIQSGWKPKNGEPRVLPIYQSTTFKYETSEQMGRLFDLEEDGYFYTRLANPTNDAVAEKICELEGGVAAMLTSSGQAANYYAAFNICNAGDHIISAATIYGGTSNLFTAKAEQYKNCFRYGELYSLNYYSEVKEKDRTYYEVYSLPRTEEVPEGYITR